MVNLLGYTHETHESLKSRCTYVHSLPHYKKCDFIIELDCDGDANFVNYHELIFCTIPSDQPVIYYSIVILMLILLALIFYYLAVSVDHFFCPVIGVISDILRLSENLSGVTLLALGNALPDIISSTTASSDGETVDMFNQLLGGSMFVTCLVGGLIAYSRPFHFEIFPFLRDMIFTLATVSLIIYLDNKSISKYGCFVFYGIYVSYIVVAVLYFFYRKRIEAHKEQEEFVDWTELRRPCIIDEKGVKELLLKMKAKNLLSDYENEKQESYFKELWNDLKVFSKEEWLVMNCCQKFFVLLQCPVLIILRLIIPTVCFGSPRHGWSKALNCINVFLFPTFVALNVNLNYSVYGISSYFIHIFIGLFFGIVVFATSKKDLQPPYHFIFAFLNLAGAIIIIFQTVNEIVSILSFFGTVLNIQSQTLMITVLAWGNGLGDAVANYSLAKQGFQRMAFSGCLAGPITTMCLGFAISFTLSTKEIIDVESGTMGPVCSLFMMINLVYSFLFMLLTNFKARKAYGLFLILIYVEFLLFCVLCELRIIHPLGSCQEKAEMNNTT